MQTPLAAYWWARLPMRLMQKPILGVLVSPYVFAGLGLRRRHFLWSCQKALKTLYVNVTVGGLSRRV